MLVKCTLSVRPIGLKSFRNDLFRFLKKNMWIFFWACYLLSTLCNSTTCVYVACLVAKHTEIEAPLFPFL